MKQRLRFFLQKHILLEYQTTNWHRNPYFFLRVVIMTVDDTMLIIFLQNCKPSEIWGSPSLPVLPYLLLDRSKFTLPGRVSMDRKTPQFCCRTRSPYSAVTLPPSHFVGIKKKRKIVLRVYYLMLCKMLVFALPGCFF